MGASKIAALLARYASAAEDPPADALTVVDGNNLAHHLAARCDTYAALDAATRAWIAARGDVVAFFDGPRPDATAKADELARRADAKGDAAAARLLEGRGALSLQLLAVEQCRASCVAALGAARVRVAAGEADDAVAAFCADAPRAVVASDDCDFLLRGLPLVRLSDGRLWRRDRVAAAALGPDARGAALLEVALLLGLEDVAASVRDVDEAVLAVARGLADDAAFVARRGDAAAAAARKRFSTVPDLATATLSESPLDAAALLETLDLAPRHAAALRRVLAGERRRFDRAPPKEDVEAAYAYERALREASRQRAAPPPLHRCFDAATFFALCDAPAALNVAAATFSPSAPDPLEIAAETFGRLDAAVEPWRPDADAWGRERLHSDVSADTWAPARDPEHRPGSSDGSSEGDSSDGGADDVSRLLAHVAALEALLAAAGVAAPPRPSRFRDDDGGGASDDDDDDDEEALPIDAYREDILQAVDAMPASIVRGETGSGKSTRLPRFLLESSANAKVVVAQPRRLAALQLYERARRNGLPAGVRVGLGGGELDAMRRRSDAGDDGKGRVRLWYMTSGVCAKLLTYKPRFFDDVTHLCVDEVHERDVDTDVALALARERLRRARLAPRVVLLSATLDAALLRRYFGAAAPLDIPGRRHDLARVCVEDLGTDRDPLLAGAWLPPRVARCRDDLARRTRELDAGGVVPRVVNAQQLELAVWLARALAAGTDGGFAARAVLIFVAGLSDIGAVADKFEALRGGNVDYVLVPVHGELPFEAQRDALLCEGLAPTGRRVVRILVATNAAESSLTLPDVDAVVDCGSRKLPTYDASCDRVLLRHAWASQATAKQRAGRTGRVAFGACYHLVSSNLLNRCRAYDAPHVQAAPLDQVVLGLRGSLPHSLAAPLLREFPSPPSEAQIADAFGLLEKRGLLEVRAAPPTRALPTDVIDAYDGTPLTPAGRLAASLPVDLRLSRLVAFGAAVGRLEDATLLAAGLGQQAPPWATPLPLPHLYADAQDYLVAARGALLGKRHFDSGDACGPVPNSTTGLGGPDQTSEFSSSIKSKSIRLIFGRIDCSRRVLEAQPKNLRRNCRICAN